MRCVFWRDHCWFGDQSRRDPTSAYWDRWLKPDKLKVSASQARRSDFRYFIEAPGAFALVALRYMYI